MGTHGISTFGVNSKFSSGNLVFYEKAYGLTTTGNILKIGTTAVQVGDTAQAVDFSWYATGSLSAVISASGATLTLAGLKLVATLPSPTSGTNNGFAVSFTGGDATPGTARAIVGSATTFSSMTSGNLVGVRGEVNVAASSVVSASYLYGTQGKLIMATGSELQTSSSHYCGVLGQLDISNGTLTAGHIAGVISSIQDTSNSARTQLNGFYAELPAYGSGAKANSVLQGFGGATYMLDMNGVNADYLFAIPATSLTPYSTGTGSLEGAKVACKIGATTYYFNVYTS